MYKFINRGQFGRLLVNNNRRVILNGNIASRRFDISKRYLNIHEYQGQEVLRKYDVPCAKGVVVTKPDQVVNAIKENFGDNDIVVKARVLAGGRGKGTFDNGFKGM